MKHIHRAYPVLIGCALILFCTSGLAVNAFGIYQPLLIAERGLSNAQASALITVRNLVSFLAMLASGAWYRRVSLRAGLGLAGLLTAAGFALYGAAKSFPVCCAASAVVGAGYGLGTLIPVALLLERWFSQKRTLAFGLCSAVTGLSTLGIPSLLLRVHALRGLSGAFYAEAVGMALLCALGSALIRSDPAELGLAPYGGAPDREAGSAQTQSASARGLLPSDWLLLVPMLLLIGAVSNVGYSHLGVLIRAAGFSMETAALAISVSGLTLTAAKCAYGALGERLGLRRSNRVFGAALLSGLALLCCMGTSTALLFFGVLFYSAGLALTTVGLTAWCGDWCRPEQYEATVRRFQIGYALGGLVFSALPGALADRSGGSYTPAYLLFTLCAAALAFCVERVYSHVQASAPTHRAPAPAYSRARL